MPYPFTKILFNKKILVFIDMLFTIIAFIIIGYFIERTQFTLLIISTGICFAGFLFLVKSNSFSLRHLLYFSIVCRAIFIFSIPILSDDYFRFLWDGHLINMGINPFLALPSALIQQAVISGNDIMQFLYAHMNSQDYFSVYPTIMQGGFLLATWLFPDSIKSPVIVFHFIILLAELGTIYFALKILKIIQLPSKNILWYVLNPLVIIELSGNLHFEALMIFFCAASIYFLLKQKALPSAIFLSLAIATKLLPLICIPFFFKYFEKRNRILFVSGIIVCVVILFIPFLNPVFLKHFSESIELYFQSFEFNGSIYKLLRWIGYQLTGYNIIQFSGIFLPMVALILIAIIYSHQYRDSIKSLLRSLLFSFIIYFALASIVHPWYVTTLVFINIFLNYKFIYLWSATVLLSYFTYNRIPYSESGFISMLEYLPVLILMIYELRKPLSIFMHRNTTKMLL